MYVHREAGLTFLASPRAASRSVRDALLEIDFEAVGEHHDGPDQGLEVVGTPFCVVRNHWDAMVSWWFNARMHTKSDVLTIEWLARKMSTNRGYFWPGRMWQFRQVPEIITLRYESLQVQLNVLLAWHDLPPVELPHTGRSDEREGRHYSTFFNSDSRLFVLWAFLPEIKELGYSFTEDPPWQKEPVPDTAIGEFQMGDLARWTAKVQEVAGQPQEHGPLTVALDAVIVEAGKGEDANG